MGCVASDPSNSNKIYIAKEEKVEVNEERVKPKRRASSGNLAHIEMESIETFITQCFLCGSNITSTYYVLQNERSTYYLRKYLESEFSQENLMYYEAANEVRHCSEERFEETVTKFSKDYLQKGSISEINLSDKLKSRLEELLKNPLKVDKAEAFKVIEQSQREVIAIIAMNQFSRFLDSKAYSEWRMEEVAQNILFVSRFPNHRRVSLSHLVVSNIQQAFMHIPKDEAQRIASYSRWISSFLAIAETIPYCISIASGHSSMPGLPLIYVNGEFEKLTGYEKKEIIGKNCKFLQGEKTETEAVKAISSALKEKNQIQTTLTNYRKDGTSFVNVLTMKPVLDEQLNLAYVIAMQMPIEIANKSQIDTLLALLPNRVALFVS